MGSLVSFGVGVVVGGLVVGFMFKNNVNKMTAFFAGFEARLEATFEKFKAEIIAEIKK